MSRTTAHQISHENDVFAAYQKQTQPHVRVHILKYCVTQRAQPNNERQKAACVALTFSFVCVLKNNVRILATSSHKGDPIDTADMSGAVAILVGSEGAGVPREYMNLADEFIRVPHSERVESLNAAIAASVILYEARRQRASHHRDAETQRNR